jgi:hypothetical protein
MIAALLETPPAYLRYFDDRGISQSSAHWRVAQYDDQSKSVETDRASLLLGRIAEMSREASHPDWDGEGSAPVEGTTVDYARLFVSALPIAALKAEVAIDRDGDIAFEWNFGPRRLLSISISRDGVLHYAGLFGPGHADGVEVFLGTSLPAGVSDVLRRLEPWI